MKKVFSAFVCAVILLCGCVDGVAATGTSADENDGGKTVTFAGKKYTLTFSDDFDSLDSSKWAYCPQQKRQDAGGVWRNSCSSFEDGNYVITCDVAEDGTPISGGIRSRNKFEQTYGLYNIRFKMEKAEGLWYAFWLLSQKMNDSTVGHGAVDGAEIDIIEVVPHEKELYTTIHWDGYGNNWDHKGEAFPIDDSFYDTYHDLWFLWDKKGYKLYLDGTAEENLIFNLPGKKYGKGTCKEPCYMKITAEYGTWGGKIDTEQLPAHFYIDYVRVYEQR